LRIMKTKSYAEETEGFDLENKEELAIDYVTKLESEAMHEVLERVAEATLQSGLRFMKTLKNDKDGEERIFLDAEDCSASVVNNFTADLMKSDYDYDFRSTRQSMDHIVVIYQSEVRKSEAKQGQESSSKRGMGEIPSDDESRLPPSLYRRKQESEDEEES